MRNNFFKIFTVCFLTIGGLLFSAPVKRNREKPPQLQAVSIVDRNGVSETIQTGERLKQFSEADLFRSQPYQRMTRIFARNSRGEQKAVLTSYYPNGQVKQYLETINQGANGPYYEWHENGQLKLRVYVIGGLGDLGPSSSQTWLFDGLAEAYDDKGRLSAEISYAKGTIDETSVYYHPNGKVHKKVPYSQGKIHGTLEMYRPDGKLFQTMTYENNEREGPLQSYWPDGKVAIKELFKNDKLMEGSYFDLEGKSVAAVKEGKGFKANFNDERMINLQEINNGIIEGEIKEYTKSGALQCSYRLKAGLKHGEEVEYYSENETGKANVKHLSVNWHEGKIQGISKTWYSNGNLESQREMSDNIKNGLLTAWYENGSLMMIEEYEKDKLVKGKYFKKGDRSPSSEVKDGKGVATLFDSSGNFLRKVTYQHGRPQE